ncbi:rhodanese-like domain-containing protein [Algoriphagus aestuariicola]|uniref:Rhodanese-like domain-containing protein n=1 Tax=Algoriphagus aestuariicola TaxID=1852016 RepID=A0ABS3BRQ2_9BACT|nr:rhodanese-like domain-containing protein [Algoriphagus aestuariicola]MBN7801030.1 rhodanese-like domain-containing protein [Algoriphagus aestuariicola]
MFSLFNTTARKFKDIPAAVFKELAFKPDTEILDVRTAVEFSSEKIEGARNLDIRNPDFLNQARNLPKDKTYLVYCRSGSRSGQACEILSELGSEKVNNLSGGLVRWPFGTI